VVVGAGITGAAAAWQLSQSLPDSQVTVLEAADRIGGKLRVSDVDGVPVDAGAESFLLARPEARSLIRDIGWSDRIEEQAVMGAGLWLEQGLRRLPRGQVMGVPTDLAELAGADVLSLRGLLRIPLDHVLAPTDFGDDVSVGDFVAARLGQEVVDKLVEPLLGGVYAGHASRLSFEAALPSLAAAARQRRSLLSAVQRVGRRHPGPAFGTVMGGMGLLPQRVLTQSGANVRTGTTATGISRTTDGWSVRTRDHRGRDQVQTADAVIVAVPATPASRLLKPIAPFAAAELSTIDYASVAVVTFVVDGQAVPEVAGTGFLVPPVSGRFIKAATFSSQKWDSVGMAAGVRKVLRTSVGRYGETVDLQLEDDEIADRAWADLREAIGVRGRPQASRVSRWGGGLPQYEVGHVGRVRRIRRALAAFPTIGLAGAALDGVGIPACIASGQAAAEAVVANLRADTGQAEWRHG
jgi:oxygen-dependent protoporphyrinogen oxidase